MPLDNCTSNHVGPDVSADRWNRGGQLLGNERLRQLEVLLDEAFRIPGTSIRFGIDGIVGLIPGFGDVIGGLLSLMIPIASWVRGVPYVTLLRMMVNVAVGVIIGSIPIFGDAFDIYWKPNRRNYGLLTRSLAEPRQHTWRDVAFLLFFVAGIGAIFALPILLLIWLASQLLRLGR